MDIHRISDLFLKMKWALLSSIFFSSKLSSLRIPLDRIAFQISTNWHDYSFFIKLSIFFLLLCGNGIKILNCDIVILDLFYFFNSLLYSSCK
jgi:hypothetical protein